MKPFGIADTCRILTMSDQLVSIRVIYGPARIARMCNAGSAIVKAHGGGGR